MARRRQTKASGRSVHSNRFSEVPSVKIPRASFDRTHTHKTTFNAGLLIPVMWDEIYPGDTVVMRPTFFGRLATPIQPVMDNMYLDVFWFFVQNRIIWENWVKMMGEQDKPGDSISFTVPNFASLGPGSISTAETIYDYMGIPINTTQNGFEQINALPFRAYVRIWNEWFRDQNLQDRIPEDTGNDVNQTYQLLRRGKRHDYLTSALPFPQKGDSVSVPIGTVANVYTTENAGQPVRFWNQAGNQGPGIDTSGATGTYTSGSGESGNLFADLSGATAATINQLRQAFQIQRLLERDARGGTRYPELLQSHFGVKDPSLAVHQRPVYLGGGSLPVNITPIAQTSETASGSQTPQGNLAAMGTVGGSGVGFTASFTEHGILMCLVSVRADLTYQQGIERKFSRRTRYDYYWPVLSHIGEQAVEKREIYADGTPEDRAVWGYQERYGELRYAPSRISGKFRSAAAGTLHSWHLSQSFASRPALNADFIEDKPPVERVIAVQDEPHFIMDMSFNSRWIRPMPVYGVPGLIDHF